MKNIKETTHSICLAQKNPVLFFEKGAVFSSCDFYNNKQMTAKLSLINSYKKTKKNIKTN